MIFLQVGAGAGDKDSRSDFKDGFTDYVKRRSVNINCRILLVEPNPINIPYLKECWVNYSQAEIYNTGICLESKMNRSITFYFAEEDAPNFQVFSMNKDHVLKHYPTSEIKEIVVDCIPLNEFIRKHVKNEKIDMLALDIEGIDSDIIMETDFSILNCDYLSFEYIHLGKKASNVFTKLGKEGFVFVGKGLDHNGYDYLFKKLSANSILRPFLHQINTLNIFLYKIKERMIKL